MCMRPPVRRFPGGSSRHPFRFCILPSAIPAPYPIPQLIETFDGEPADYTQVCSAP